MPEESELREPVEKLKPIGNKPRVFISYAHKSPRQYFESFVKGISEHVDWDIFHDGDIEIGEDWDKRLETEVRKCDFAILLVTPPFLQSKYIKNKEFGPFLERQSTNGFKFFSVLVSRCRYKKWKDLAKTQFFTARGNDYGLPDIGDEQITYDTLVDKGKSFYSHRNNFHLNFVEKVEEAMDL